MTAQPLGTLDSDPETEEPPSLKGRIFTPRGLRAALPHGGLPEVISPYLIDLIAKTGGVNGPIGRQFVAQPKKEQRDYRNGDDPLIEDEHEVAPGLIYKYRGHSRSNREIAIHGRVLWTITRYCASYCRFCTRGREVGAQPTAKLESRGALAEKPILTEAEITTALAFLDDHPEINEVILSGGDPLVTPQSYLTKIITELVKRQRRKQLSIIRLGTRLPIANPDLIRNWHYDLLAKIKNPYLMVHINHPAELTPKSLKVLNHFRTQSLATVLSQTVLLKGVNDSVATLYELFEKLAQEGIRPYYVYQNDPVSWAKHFTVPIRRAIRLWQQLRPILSGVAATARFVIDTPFGFGKIPIPEGGAWKVDYRHFRDFQGKKHATVRNR